MGLRYRHGKRILILGQVPLHVPESVRGGGARGLCGPPCADHPMQCQGTMCPLRAAPWPLTKGWLQSGHGYLGLFPHAPSCRPHQTTRAFASSPSVCPNHCSILHSSQSSSEPHLPDPIHPPPPLPRVQTSPYSCFRQWFLSSALPHILFSKCSETSRVRT